MAGATGNLVMWKPGQSGNPKGSSKKARRSKRLREALDTILENEIPDELLERITPEIRAQLPEGVTFAEVIALRVTMLAATATKPEQILAASSMILGAQAKPDTTLPPPERKPPVLPSTDERRKAVAEQLGVEE